MNMQPPKTRPWFRLTNTGSSEVIEGIKFEDGLQLTIRFGDEYISAKVLPESTDKLIKWLVRAYPGSVTKQEITTDSGGDKNVIRLASKLPVSDPP